MKEAVTIRKFHWDSFTVMNIMAPLNKIAEMPYQLQGVNLEHSNSFKICTMIYRYDYTLSVLTVTVNSGAGSVSWEPMFTDGLMQPKQLWADVEIALVDGRRSYSGLQDLSKQNSSALWVCSGLLMVLLLTPAGVLLYSTGDSSVRAHM